MRGFPETYVQKVKLQHSKNGGQSSSSSNGESKLFEPSHCDVSRTFGIQHYAGQVGGSNITALKCGVFFFVLLFNTLTQIQ